MQAPAGPHPALLRAPRREPVPIRGDLAAAGDHAGPGAPHRQVTPVDRRRPFPAALLLAICGALASPSVPAHWAYVTNEKDDTVSVIDTETDKVVETIDVGERPRDVILSRDFTRPYVCASDSDAVQVMDIATREIIHGLPSGEDPEQFVLRPDDRHLYIANENGAIATVVAQIDTGVEPESTAVSARRGVHA